MEKLQSLPVTRKTFDPSKSGDPAAMQTEWTPAKRDGTNFQTQKLVEININRIEFLATNGAIAIYILFALMGLMTAIAFFIKLSSGLFNAVMIMPLLVGLIFTIVGGCMFYFGTAPVVFDKYKGFFWKGRRSPDEESDRKEIKYFIALEDIHSLQLISEYCGSDRSPYYSYELNLVLINGSRINVVDHANLVKLREDAQTLSAFLGKPVWDAI
jgi:hypothetical protein